MTFRRPLRQKWFYPIILCACTTLGFVTFSSRLPNIEKLGAGGWAIAFTACCLYWSWEAWTARIDVDREGVRWKEGEQQGDLLWEEIARLDRDGSFLGIVERSSGRTFRLPFVTRALYGALAKRLRPLRPVQEKFLFSEFPDQD